MRSALSWSTLTYGMEHPMTLQGITRLATLLRLNGEFEASELLQRRNLWKYTKSLGPTHEDTLSSAQECTLLMAGLDMSAEAAS